MRSYLEPQNPQNHRASNWYSWSFLDLWERQNYRLPKDSIDAQTQKYPPQWKSTTWKSRENCVFFPCPRMFFVFGCRGSVHWFYHIFYLHYPLEQKHLSLLNSMERSTATTIPIGIWIVECCVCTWEHLPPPKKTTKIVCVCVGGCFVWPDDRHGRLSRWWFQWFHWNFPPAK